MLAAALVTAGEKRLKTSDGWGERKVDHVRRTNTTKTPSLKSYATLNVGARIY